MNKTKKIILAALAFVLACAGAAAGTYAYLNNRSEPVVNTFVAMGGGRLCTQMDILESPVTGDEDGNYRITDGDPVTSNEYRLAPGKDFPKDPYICIRGKTETPSYLYLEVKDSISQYQGITWTLDGVWSKLEGVTGKAGGQVYCYTGPLSYNGGLIDNTGSDDFSHIKIISDNLIHVASGTDTSALYAKTVDIITGERTPETLEFNAYLAQANAGSGPTAVFRACF